MNEAQTRHDLIDPALKEAGWNTLLAVIMKNYVRDGVWTLTAESFRDLLLQMYTTLGGAYRKLDFKTPLDAMDFYGKIQREIYAA